MTLGIDNRNPWNVKNDPERPWKGSTGTDKYGHAIFAHELWSARAACRTLAKKYLNGKTTLLQIISSYAPVSDGNCPEEYARFLARHLGVTIREPLNLFASSGRVRRLATLRMLLYQMAIYENGACYRPNLNDIDEGIVGYEADYCKDEA